MLLAPTLGGLLVGLFIYYFMPERRNHGIPDIMEACAYRGGRMDIKAGIGAPLPKSASIEETRKLLARTRAGVVFVIDENKRLIGGLTSAGFLERTHNIDAGRQTAGDVARPCKTVILPHASLERALKLMAQSGAEYLPVVDDIQARSNAADEGNA